MGGVGGGGGGGRNLNPGAASLFCPYKRKDISTMGLGKPSF